MSDWNQTLGAGRLIANSRAPYFRSLLHGLVPVEAPGLGTMAVTNTGLLLIDPDFAKRVTAEQMAGLLCHEIMHVTCGHVTPQRAIGRDKRYLGVAQDLAINPAVRDMGFQLPTGDLEGCFPETEAFPKADGFHRGLTADEYYELLLKKRDQQQKKQGQGNGGAGGAGKPSEPNDESGEGGEGGDADHDHPGDGGTDGDPQLPSKPSTGKGWCGSCGAREVPKEPKGKEAEAEGVRSDKELQRLIRATAEAVREAAENGGTGRGNMPAMLKRWADEMLKPPQIPWNVKLRRAQLAAMAWQAGAVDHRYDGPSRRQAGLGFGLGSPILPRLRAPKPIVDVVGDTSGSMSKNEIANVCSETMGIVKQCNATVRFSACDAGTEGVRKIATAEELADALVGGGGTDMRPGFKALMAERPTPKVIVCITDGCVGDGFPKHPIPGVKVIIVIVGPHGTPIPNTEWAETIVVPPGAKLEEYNEDAA